MTSPTCEPSSPPLVLREPASGVHLAGASYGAMVALHAALTDSGAIHTLSLWEPPLFTAGPVTRPVLDAA